MSITLKLNRGDNDTVDATTGADGELQVNLDNKTVHVHDGVTAGGSEIVNRPGYYNPGRDADKSRNKMLFNKNGVIVDVNGDPIRAIGMNIGLGSTLPFFTDYWNSGYQESPVTTKRGTDALYDDIRWISSLGFEYVRMWVPAYTPTMFRDAAMGEEYGIGVQGVIEGWKSILQFCADQGVGVILVVGGVHQSVLEAFGTEGVDGPDTFLDHNSDMMQAWGSWLTEFATGIKDEPGLAFWEISNEANNSAGYDATPNTSLTWQGSPSGHWQTWPAGQTWNSVNVGSWIAFSAQIIKNVDTHGRMVSSGENQPTSSYKTWKDTVYMHEHPEPCDVVSWHGYAGGRISNASGDNMRDTWIVARRKFAADGRPFYIGEFGYASPEGATATDPGWGPFSNKDDALMADQYPAGPGRHGYEMHRVPLQALYDSGIQLGLLWQWNRNEATAVSFDCHPLNTWNSEVIEMCREYNLMMKAEGYVDPWQTHTLKISDSVPTCLNLNGASYSLPTSNTIENSNSIGMSFWLKLNASVTDTTTLMSKLNSDTWTNGPAGWQIVLSPTTFFTQLLGDKSGSTYWMTGAGPIENYLSTSSWSHIYLSAVTSENDTVVTAYVNGNRWFKTVHSGTTWKPQSNKELVIGNGIDAGIKDLLFFKRELNENEIRDVMLYGVEFENSTFAKWDFDNTLADSVSNFTFTTTSTPSFTDDFMPPDNLID